MEILDSFGTGGYYASLHGKRCTRACAVASLHLIKYSQALSGIISIPLPYSHRFMFRKNRFTQVRTVIFLSLLLVAALHLVSIVPACYHSLASYRLAREINSLTKISDDLFTAVGNYGFERGRVNVVLHDAGPVEKMAANRQFILAHRAEGDRALQCALEQLKTSQQAEIAPYLEAISEHAAQVKKLRVETAENLIIPKEKRRDDLAEIWFAAMTEYIESIQALLTTLLSDISNNDGMISRYSSLKQETMGLRNSAGPEMSILSATILSKEPIEPALAEKIHNLQLVTDDYFKRISLLIQPLKNSRIPAAYAELRNMYFEQYLPYRAVILPLASVGGPYPYSETEFLTHGVAALEQVATFMKAVVDETRSYSARQVEQAKGRIVIQMMSGIGSLLAILLIFLYVHFQIARPIEQVTSSVRRLNRKDPDVDVPFQAAQNEIGEMARAVEVFKGMALQLDRDVATLEAVSAEREQLIEKLQATLNEVKVLRDIIPICSICKNIRNDEGYFEQIENYFHRYTGVDFSHTICLPCMKKHYPEEYGLIGHEVK